MKHVKRNLLLTAVSVLIFSNVLSGQNIPSDTLYAEVRGDTVFLSHDRTFRNCASKFELSYTLSNNILTVWENDTTGDVALCNCIFDLKLQIADLSFGSYTALFYGTNALDDTTFYGEVNFIINDGGNPQSGGVLVSQRQSDCYTILSESDANSLPQKFKLSHAYPNPFNPSTRIKFEIPSAGQVNLKIYTLSGELIAELVNSILNPGKYITDFNAKDKASGIYLIVLNFKNKSITQKALLIK